MQFSPFSFPLQRVSSSRPAWQRGIYWIPCCGRWDAGTDCYSRTSTASALHPDPWFNHDYVTPTAVHIYWGVLILFHSKFPDPHYSDCSDLDQAQLQHFIRAPDSIMIMFTHCSTYLLWSTYRERTFFHVKFPEPHYSNWSDLDQTTSTKRYYQSCKFYLFHS